MIIQSGNPNLFPDLKIPRTTALYWINYSKEKTLVTRPQMFEDEVHSLKKELFQQKAINLLLSRILENAFENEYWHGLLGAKRREKIVRIVEEMRMLVPIAEMLLVLGLSMSTYYRYRAEFLGCNGSQNYCESTRPNQLTKDEQKKMIALALNPKLAHLSMRSLMYHAQREKILFCGIDSWYKYLRINHIKRTTHRKRKRKCSTLGIRANYPNELWHIDITEVKTITGEKLYIQMIVDNFSRAILSWKIGKYKKMELSLRSIRQGVKNVGLGPDYLMSDGGGENDNKKVSKLLLGQGISRLIAKSDVIFSNSMIEAVFRQLKKNPKIDKIQSAGSLSRFVDKFVSSYNLEFPHSSLEGAKPFEKLTNSWNGKDFRGELKSLRKEVTLQRSREYKKCKGCLIDFVKS